MGQLGGIFDDDFVASATTHEPSAAERRRDARRARRRQRWRSFRRTAIVVVMVPIVFLVGLSVSRELSTEGGLVDAGFGFDRGEVGAGLDDGVERPEDEEPELAGREYRVGDCVYWDDTSDAWTVNTKVVPCDEPHQIEISGSIEVEGGRDDYPSDAQWMQIADRDCREPNEAYFGGAWSRTGPIISMMLRPTESGWKHAFDRQVWCGLTVVEGPMGSTDSSGLATRSVLEWEPEAARPVEN